MRALVRWKGGGCGSDEGVKKGQSKAPGWGQHLLYLSHFILLNTVLVFNKLYLTWIMK